MSKKASEDEDREKEENPAEVPEGMIRARCRECKQCKFKKPCTSPKLVEAKKYRGFKCGECLFCKNPNWKRRCKKAQRTVLQRKIDLPVLKKRKRCEECDACKNLKQAKHRRSCTAPIEATREEEPDLESPDEKPVQEEMSKPLIMKLVTRNSNEDTVAMLLGLSTPQQAEDEAEKPVQEEMSKPLIMKLVTRNSNEDTVAMLLGLSTPQQAEDEAEDEIGEEEEADTDTMLHLGEMIQKITPTVKPPRASRCGYQVGLPLVSVK
eukprot:TRINITY_DN16925_c0_g1_i2.p1 TRINITY_DN16925_c0_g1~~TRINITY_DN16925_c0_g1_i2.p1  ORF type:complete len:265 (+),score=77.45 TRINITY_DN16925_c0_g1_i2:37-831(+)